MKWGRCLCASISIVSSGLSAVCCGSGISLGIGVRGLLWVCLVVVDGVLVFEVIVCLSLA